MARFRIRLDDEASGEFRVYVTHAATEEEAVETVLMHEGKKVRFQIPEDDLADLEAREAVGKLSKGELAHLLIHRQTAGQYTVTSVKEG